MPTDRLKNVLQRELKVLTEQGVRKGFEDVFVSVVPPRDGHGPRYILEGFDDRPFIRMNSNSYLGMSLQPSVTAAGETMSRTFGAGPGAVRFISGTYQAHKHLEQRLAEFHGREAAMIYNSAYAAVVGILAPLTTADTLVLSDELNHNSIINALRLSRPRAKDVYRHLAIGELESRLEQAASRQDVRRVVIVTDGIFSMRGDNAPLDEIVALTRQFDHHFPENVILIVDDSHGVGAFGVTGRGTEEHCGARSDLLIGTLGKAFGVNGGYVVADATTIEYLRETSPLYIYSNPISPGEAAAARQAVELVDGAEGKLLLEHLRSMTERFRQGLSRLGLESIPGHHPVVPVMVRDTTRTSSLVRHLRCHGILATGLNYPVVPKGDETIRFQISAEHQPADIDYVLEVLGQFRSQPGQASPA